MNDLITTPATLNEAILSGPVWLQLWVLTLVLANLGALLFVFSREQGAWRVRKEPVAIIFGFIVAALIMDWIYGSYGYVRLLGLGHLLAWTPAYIYVLSQRKRHGVSSWFGKYVHFYLLIAGISLCIDTVDVIRYLLGDGAL